MIREANRLYAEWDASQDKPEPAIKSPDTPQVVEKNESVLRHEMFEKAEEQSRDGIASHIHKLGPYDFQELVGELLRGMGYHVAHIAPRGPDGGVDLIVYKDPLGTVPPRIKVQVKHRRDSKVTVSEVRELHGLLHNDEVGLLISTGGFSSEAAREVRAASKHIDMIDLERFVALWQQHYEKISEEGRATLPLAPVFFLVPDSD